MRKYNYNIFTMILLAVFLINPVKAANTSITGFVTDGITGDPLIGANIILMGTSMGTSSDMNGKYIIPKVLPGNYTLRVSYIGYREVKTSIDIKEGDVLKQDFKLEPVGVEGKEIVVTGQAYGQTQAINQQLSSNQISNVVSQSKIQELPDNTVAESVGRLPGVTVLRTGGEGNEVVVRGLQPKFNQITIDGIQMSSSNPNDRSIDLSMISSNMLDGIQVSKSVTADMDADVIGGTINFQLREAKRSETGRPEINILSQGSYNGLSNAYNKLNNYKYVGSVEDRFFDDQFGLFAQFDIERKNLTSNEFGAIYGHYAASLTDYITTGLNLYNIPRDRQRTNLALVLDYKLPEGKVKLTNFYSTGTTITHTRGEGFLVNTSPTTQNQHEYSFNFSKSKLNTITNTLELDHQIPIFHLNAKFSHTYSETKNPDDWKVSFIQSSAGLSQFSNLPNVDPRSVPKAANNNLAQTNLNTFVSNNSLSKQRALSMQADLDVNVNFSDFITANIKYGGKYRYQTRENQFAQFDGQGLSLQSAKLVDDLITSYFNMPSTLGTNLPIGYFTDPGYDYGKYLGGEYKMISPLNFNMLSSMADLLKGNLDYFAANGADIAYARNNYLSTTSNYKGHENLSAFYVMSIVNVGEQLTLIPGIRYQNLQTNYTSPRGIQGTQSYLVYKNYDTTIVRSHGFWLPDLSIKYKPLSWFDIRFAYSNTIAYPDYSTITPKIHVGFGTIEFNNIDLVPGRSTNYDVAISVYENSIGLITIGGFLKEIKNLIYPTKIFVSGAAAIPYFPASYVTSNPGSFEVHTFSNNPYKINDYGAEIDWQTHFWYLPEPLSGLVFNINYTHIFSKAQYPYQTLAGNPRNPTIVDTFYVDRLIDQPNDIINMALGFDYRGFSARVSLLFQDNIFTDADWWPQLRANTAIYRRWDIALKQELPWFGIQLFGDLNNINGAKDVSVLQVGGVPQSQQDYGMTANFGFRLKF